MLIYTDLSLIFAFMMAYTVSTIMLSFFLSTLFDKVNIIFTKIIKRNYFLFNPLKLFQANIAAAAGGIIFFCIYLPYSFMVVWESKITHSVRIASVRK